VPRSWRYRGIQSAFVTERYEPDRDHPLRVTFTVSRLAGVHGEVDAPPAADAVPEVVVFYGEGGTIDYWSSWKSLADGVREPLGKALGDLPQIVDRIRARHHDPDSALAECFHWIQGHIHSIAERPWSERTRASESEPAESIRELLDRR